MGFGKKSESEREREREEEGGMLKRESTFSQAVDEYYPAKAV